jgi:hypothetical protein
MNPKPTLPTCHGSPPISSSFTSSTDSTYAIRGLLFRLEGLLQLGPANNTKRDVAWAVVRVDSMDKAVRAEADTISSFLYSLEARLRAWGLVRLVDMLPR